ncbi:hypothetical protein F8M41_016844 [Gigaspora margarita]|uniref:Uncharacterized protein n=1 Tax=Gigaspora margarita TaxID=4874 RepID=A0A8H4AP29_GIGMA|nr:hypothetical protein F8M41_016844 [Gigaspora margarita]
MSSNKKTATTKTNDTNTTPKTNDATTASNNTTTPTPNVNNPSETYYVPPTPPNPRPSQRTPNSRNSRRNRSNNSTYGILQDDEYYKERGDFWIPLSEASIRRRIENYDWDDMNPDEAQEALDQM